MRTAEQYLRILKTLKYFMKVENESPYLRLDGLVMGESERILGVYENSPQNLILISNQGLHCKDHLNWRRINYIDIRSVGLADNNKDSEVLRVGLASSHSELISVTGREGKFRDTFEFMRFLMRVTDT